jgi:hypothetical protein
VAGGAESLGSLASRPVPRALSSDNRRITSSLTPADVDRTASRGDTCGQSAAFPVERYQETDGCYAVPYKYKFYSLAMNPSRQPIPKWQIAAMACLAAAWIALTTPLVLGRGDVDAFFLRTFKAYSRSSHPYLSLTPLFLQLWLAYTCLLMFSSVAIARRKADLFTVLCVGPALACGVAAMAVSWSDPDWLLVSGVCLIGCAVGLVSGAGYCAYTSFMGKVEPSDAADSR